MTISSSTVRHSHHSKALRIHGSYTLAPPTSPPPNSPLPSLPTTASREHTRKTKSAGHEVIDMKATPTKSRPKVKSFVKLGDSSRETTSQRRRTKIQSQRTDNNKPAVFNTSLETSLHGSSSQHTQAAICDPLSAFDFEEQTITALPVCYQPCPFMIPNYRKDLMDRSTVNRSMQVLESTHRPMYSSDAKVEHAKSENWDTNPKPELHVALHRTTTFFAGRDVFIDCLHQISPILRTSVWASLTSVKLTSWPLQPKIHLSIRHLLPSRKMEKQLITCQGTRQRNIEHVVSSSSSSTTIVSKEDQLVLLQHPESKPPPKFGPGSAVETLLCDQAYASHVRLLSTNGSILPSLSLAIYNRHCLPEYMTQLTIQRSPSCTMSPTDQAVTELNSPHDSQRALFGKNLEAEELCEKSIFKSRRSKITWAVVTTLLILITTAGILTGLIWKLSKLTNNG